MNSCFDCKYYSYWRETESWEMPHIYTDMRECSKVPTNANLKSFPFLNTKCIHFENKLTKVETK